MKKRSTFQPNSVFLNLPFDLEFEPIFVSYVVGLVTLGLMPRCVLELDEDGEGRMARLYRLLKDCGSSIHDLSYRGQEFRYNMPFELGVAYALSRSDNKQSKRRLVIFEAEKRDLLKTLSDLRSFDPKIHEMDGGKALSMIYESFYTPSRPDPEKRGREIYQKIVQSLPEYRGGRTSIFNRKSFLTIVKLVLDLNLE